jgi:hypothetical protein
MRDDNVPAAKPKLSVETPIWAPGQPLRGQLRSLHWAIWVRVCVLPSAGQYISAFDRWVASVKTRTTWAVSEGQSSLKPATDDVCSHRYLEDASCHDLTKQFRPASQRPTNRTVVQVAWRTGELGSHANPSL